MQIIVGNKTKNHTHAMAEKLIDIEAFMAEGYCKQGIRGQIIDQL